MVWRVVVVGSRALMFRICPLGYLMQALALLRKVKMSMMIRMIAGLMCLKLSRPLL
jgi:hypothetical protein